MLHGTQKLLDRSQVTAVLHSLPQNTGSFSQRDAIELAEFNGVILLLTD